MFGRKKTILVTGAKGQLGSYLVDYFSKKSIEKSRIEKVFGIDVSDLDIRDTKAVHAFFNSTRGIDYVVHCAAATDTMAIEKDPMRFYAVNCLGAKNIAEACAKNSIRLIHISTDYVLSELSPFDASAKCFQEFPVNQYGLQKLVAELFAKEAYRAKPKDCLVMRSSWMYGNSDRSFVEKLLKNIFTKYSSEMSNKPFCVGINVTDDTWGRPTPVWLIAHLVDQAIEHGWHGVMNAQYDMPQMTRFEWAEMIWRAFVCSDHDMSRDLADVINDMKQVVKICPASSNEVGGAMRHPGKVEVDASAERDLSQCQADTEKYVKYNINRLLQMAKDICIPAK